MADWRRLTDTNGDSVDVNLDAIIEIRRYPAENCTLLRGAFLEGYTISVKEEPDQIYAQPSLGVGDWMDETC